MLRALLCVLLFAGIVRPAWAAECPAEPSARVAFLTQHLRSETQRAQRWTLGWTVGFSALAVGQLALVPVARSNRIEAFNRDRQPDLLIGAAASTVGLVTLLASRLTILRDGPAYLSLSCPTESEGLAALKRSAESEALGTGPLMHVANAAFNVGVGLVLGIVFKRWQTALINTLVGTTIGELKILTQPTGSIDALRRFEAGGIEEKGSAVTWELLPGPTGVAIAGTF
jgi:hypothetical protein